MNSEYDDPRLASVLDRFAPGWGPHVECGSGWWPIVAELDRKISEIAPDYQVVQIKERFGGLRYYLDEGSVEHVSEQVDRLIDQPE